MTSGSGPKWALDETSLLLGSLVLVVYLYNYLNLPTPDCHPALLANQASFSPTHLKNETPIVRHKSTYFSTPLATSPNREWQTLNHLLKDVESKNFDFLGNLTRGQISWLSSKNLLSRSKALGSGIKQKLPQAENLIILGDNDVHSLLAILAGFQYGLKVLPLSTILYLSTLY
ncbi:hypothetical protein CONCODRAFT_96720 [Conidiobolus coronatus NRRL 28638]|uniref:AMP-dependent synthetase/ligase domain-containing protein n=1 Tax=Conidiobolus coronatus (strain ATCC 28846 / CBS 209.66 / NRRL 28638) TaxID=796925 RepID=A0A137P2X8_CONC2|nr:hypothetical protein CONCODRAFT_96720 [Conidiobolus coronatus NRRL 28638]|eukprot:KXN69373.1 hypothetical protein CONCODRAFT_96720 [Conidiobolus coronatus NRRL 28638]